MAKVKLSREEKKDIRVKRKRLRKQLREQGIKSRREFERIAFELGLSYSEDGKLLGFWFWLDKAIFALQGLGFTGVLAILGAGALALFAWATITQEKGNFTVNLTGELLDSGFILSETEGFEDPKVTLATETLLEVNASSIADLPEDLPDHDGSHNGKNYVAYTFYIRNEGEQPNGYTYYLTLNSHSKGVQKATWVMLFDEDGQEIFATKSADGNREDLFGYYSAPLGSQAKDYDKQYYQEGDRFGVRPTSFRSDAEVARGSVEKVPVGGKKKYTVVIWVEGDDPECTNELLGGHAGFEMEFRPHESSREKDGVLDGIEQDEDEYINETDRLNKDGLKDEKKSKSKKK